MTEPPIPSWHTGSGALSVADPLYLGILNVTPDSFSDGGRFQDADAALAQARGLLAQGAGALDVGGESTRPQASPVAAEAEWARLEPVLRRLRAELPQVPLSLDTRHAGVALRGLQSGVAILNDVTGFRDPELLRVARASGCGLIAMRSRLEGDGFAMPPYGLAGPDQADAAIAELAAVRDRLLGAGIEPQRILLDPGFGFGTTFTEDRALWAALERLPAALDWPVQRFCLGISRKRFLAWRAGTPALAPADRDALTAQAHREALGLGYRVFRTHTAGLPSIRLAGPADADALARIQVASWRAAYGSVMPAALLANLTAAPHAAAFREMLAPPQAPGFRLWVLEWRGRLMGYAAAGPCRDTGFNPATTAELYALYFLKEAWGHGLGRALMAAVLAEFRRQGFQRATLWVLERNARARKFYQAGQWRPTQAPRTIWQDGIALREIQYQISLESPAAHRQNSE